MKPTNLLEEIDRIEAHFNAIEPDVQAFLPEPDRFDRLRREARLLLDRFPSPAERPALFGMLAGVKDIFRVDGFPTRAGSRLPAELFSGGEAESVTRLKNAGALILGKTVSTEFAYFAPGPTRNPRNLNYTPGGSSSGSAAAVAATLCPIALGTQTIGSIIRPAAFCGVVGYKPSYDRVSRSGVIPVSPSLDHVGLFAANVADVERAAKVVISNWRHLHRAADAVQVLEIEKRRPVLGIPEGPYLDCASEEGLSHFRSDCARLKAIGYEIKAIEAMQNFQAIRDRHNLIVAAEAARVHTEWFHRYGDLYQPKTAELIRRGQSISDETLANTLQSRAQLRDELTALMTANQIDVWIAPSAPGTAPKGLDSTGDPVMNLPWTHGGLPSINLPSGVNEAGLPFGLQIIGRWYQDEPLLSWSQELEFEFRV